MEAYGSARRIVNLRERDELGGSGSSISDGVMELWLIVREISFYRSSLVLKVSLLIATTIAHINRVIAKLRNCPTNKTVPPHRSQDLS